MEESSLAAKVTDDALEKSFNFAVQFHLDPKKGQSNRTTGQTRGLGGVIDSFLRGKVIELAIVDILKKINPNKDYHLDFKVHDADDTDPDVIKITEGNSKRDPKLFIEIKNTSEADRWIGLHEEQFETIKKNKIVGSDLSKIFIIYASIKNSLQSNDKSDDLLGIYMKSKLNTAQFEKFSNVSDLYVEIISAISADELFNEGTHFEKGYYFYETNVFRQVDLKYRDRKNVNKVDVIGNSLPKFQYDKKYPYPEKFGNLNFRGKVEAFKKRNEKSNRMYIYCITDVKVSNNIIGEFELKKGSLYEYMPKTVGRNPVLNRNNVWIAKRNIHSAIKKSPAQRIQEIANSI